MNGYRGETLANANKSTKQLKFSFIIDFFDYTVFMKYLPSTKQLQYLIALAQTEHFSKAADLCNVTQSTLSAGIKELEVIFAVTLAERTKRSVIMTPIGKKIAERAEKLIADAEQMMALTTAVQQPLTGKLKLGVIPTIAPYLLPKILPTLRANYPHLDLELRETQTDILIEEVTNGKIDIALLALPASQGRLMEQALFEDPFLLLTPNDHPLSKQKTIDAGKLANEHLLLLEEGHCFRDQAIEFCTKQGVSNGFSTLGATSLATVSQMVAANFGLTLLPKMAREKEVGNNKSLITRPFQSPEPTRTIGLIWRKTTSRLADFESLAQVIKSTQEI